MAWRSLARAFLSSLCRAFPVFPSARETSESAAVNFFWMLRGTDWLAQDGGLTEFLKAQVMASLPVLAGFEHCPVAGSQVRAYDRVHADADAPLAGVGLRAGVAVVAGGAVGLRRIGASAGGRVEDDVRHGVKLDPVRCRTRGRG